MKPQQGAELFQSALNVISGLLALKRRHPTAHSHSDIRETSCYENQMFITATKKSQHALPSAEETSDK
jgi:hypothetical protein